MNIHKHAWTFSDGKTHSQIGHILMDKELNSTVVDVRHFTGSNYDTDHYLVVEKVRERERERDCQ
jgi:hypothetical protein